SPPGGGATAAQVWGYATRGLTGDAANAIRDAILSDATKIPGANVNAAIGDVKAKTDNIPASPAPSGEYNTEMAHLDADVSTRSTLAQSDILDDATPFGGAKVAKIQDFTEDSLGTLSATGSEDDIRESTDEGKLHCFIDLSNMVSLDSITVRQFIKIKAAGSYIKYAEEAYTDAQTLPMLYIVTKPSKHGIKITLEQTAGTNRDYDWETFIEKAA
ncbi:MAG: hypothetical protein KKD44_25900, partial [Proteobacteria bacterium]|nr:hypothetical protein [Pseudomonadota bacterium]